MSYYQNVEKKLQRVYERGEVHRSFVTNEPFFVEIRLRAPTQKELQNDFVGYKKAIEKLRSRFRVEMEEKNYKQLGTQLLPKKVVYAEIEPFLRAINKFEEFQTWKKAYEYYVEKLPKLKTLFLQKPFLALENSAIAKEVVAIAEFFIHNPKPLCYVRELPILGIDTKFIEKNRKFLDQVLGTVLQDEEFDTSITQLGDGGFERKYGLKTPPTFIRFRTFGGLCGFEDVSLPLESFAKLQLDLKAVFIVENLQTFLAFPLQKGMMVVFGKGYSASGLQAAKWLYSKKIYYFGDIDIDGLAILSSFRSVFPDTKSCCMDMQTLKTYEKLAHFTEQKTKEMPKNLTQKEQELYSYLLQTKKDDKTLRLEQERIQIMYIKKAIDIISF